MKLYAVLPIRPFTAISNVPTVPDTVTLNTVDPSTSVTVGVASSDVRAYTKPLSVMEAPPSEVTSPCRVAPPGDIEAATPVITSGAAMTSMVKFCCETPPLPSFTCNTTL